MLTLSPITPVTCRPDHLRMLHQVTLHRHKRLQQELESTEAELADIELTLDRQGLLRQAPVRAVEVV